MLVKQYGARLSTTAAPAAAADAKPADATMADAKAPK
jgi:hypothetical protein